jgi:subtilisin family serine protease
MRIGTPQNTAGSATGKQIDVDIAILDTGIQRDHPDLNVVGWGSVLHHQLGCPSRRGTFSDSQYDDDNGHGTHVAGIAAALDNSNGVVGVAPGARLHAVKVLGANGSGNMSDIIAGVDWVTARADTIEVANMSLGGGGWSPGLYTAIQNSVNAGVVYVVAAGNSGIDIHGSDKTFGTSDDFIPAALPAGGNHLRLRRHRRQAGGNGGSWYWSAGSRWLADDTFADFSNFSNSDETKNQAWLDQNIAILGQERHELGLGIDLVLPGVDIYSTYLNNGYATATGTSMAAPHAAGLAALHIAANERPAGAGAEWVYGVRRALIDMGNRWRSPLGLVHQVPNPDSPDKYEENVGWAGNQEVALTINLTQPADGAMVYGEVEIRAVSSHADAGSVSFTVGNQVLTGQWHQNGYWYASWDTTNVGDGQHAIIAEVVVEAESASTSIVVTVQNNTFEPTTVLITSPINGATVSGDVQLVAEVDSDPRVEVTFVQFFISNSTGTSRSESGTETDGVWSAVWSTKDDSGFLFPNGEYTLTAEATDSRSNSSSHSVQIVLENVDDPPVTETVTATLDGRAIPVNRNFWQAEVTVTVSLHPSGGPVADALVSGRWSTNSSVSGTTDASGVVTFNSGNLRTNVNSIYFDLIAVSSLDYEYSPMQMAAQIDDVRSAVRVNRLVQRRVRKPLAIDAHPLAQQTVQVQTRRRRDVAQPRTSPSASNSA